MEGERPPFLTAPKERKKKNNPKETFSQGGVHGYRTREEGFGSPQTIWKESKRGGWEEEESVGNCFGYFIKVKSPLSSNVERWMKIRTRGDSFPTSHKRRGAQRREGGSIKKRGVCQTTDSPRVMTTITPQFMLPSETLVKRVLPHKNGRTSLFSVPLLAQTVTKWTVERSLLHTL